VLTHPPIHLSISLAIATLISAWFIPAVRHSLGIAVSRLQIGHVRVLGRGVEAIFAIAADSSKSLRITSPSLMSVVMRVAVLGYFVVKEHPRDGPASMKNGGKRAHLQHCAYHNPAPAGYPSGHGATYRDRNKSFLTFDHSSPVTLPEPKHKRRENRERQAACLINKAADGFFEDHGYRHRMERFSVESKRKRTANFRGDARGAISSLPVLALGINRKCRTSLGWATAACPTPPSYRLTDADFSTFKSG
jgi:hypothetical protein